MTGEGGLSEEEKARMVLEDIAERLPESYDMEDIRGCGTPAPVCTPLVSLCAALLAVLTMSRSRRCYLILCDALRLAVVCYGMQCCQRSFHLAPETHTGKSSI